MNHDLGECPVCVFIPPPTGRKIPAPFHVKTNTLLQRRPYLADLPLLGVWMAQSEVAAV